MTVSKILDLVNMLMFADVCSSTSTEGGNKGRESVRIERVAIDRGE